MQFERKSWDEFCGEQLLWWVNRSLRIFGWAIAVEKEHGKIVNAYPARVVCRGFDRDDEEKGFAGLTAYMAKQSPVLLRELHDPEKFLESTPCICERCFDVVKSIRWVGADELLCGGCSYGWQPAEAVEPTEEQKEILIRQRKEFEDWKKEQGV